MRHGRFAAGPQGRPEDKPPDSPLVATMGDRQALPARRRRQAGKASPTRVDKGAAARDLSV
ncbi:hypothetical protein Ssi02_31070 [Sinosporangium siamense]|uniref:Uncharacterized protein n=1 Tax=Sinosporangium siamense TaxID=1367973 RepID=A0A919RJ01_9ACTN|nr:hypothetical protein Ssi02_31070 [Sinosporangium siamense]